MSRKANNLIPRICLGTVQFGLDYGIANNRGKVPRQEVFEVLKYAQGIGLNTLDTSVAYGDSERIIGEYIEKAPIPFEIVSKILVDSGGFDPDGVRLELQGSLQRLKVKKLHGCLIHRFEDFLKHDQLWNVLETFKKENLVEKIGFSLYRPGDLDLIRDRGISFDIIQVPFSIFDRRFEKYFESLKDQNIEIHVRSVFLQGLAFLRPDRLPDNLRSASKTIQDLQRISERHDLSINAICLNYVLLNSFVDKAAVGIDGLEHFRNNIDDLDVLGKVSDIKDDLQDLAISDEEVLLPFKWERQGT